MALRPPTNSSQLKRRWVAALLATSALLGVAATRGGAQIDGERGTLLAAGQTPFTDSWRAMLRRDRQTRARLQAATGEEAVPPLGDYVKRAQPEPLASTPVLSATVAAPQAIGASFQGIGLQDYIDRTAGRTVRPPDTMGAIGPDHFMQAMNTGVAIYNRAGTRLSYVHQDTFFAISIGGDNQPHGLSFDTRVLFDQSTGRWIATAEDFHEKPESNHLYLAISRTADPTGVWDKYVVTIGLPDRFADYPTLGMDSNGIYVGVSMFDNSNPRIRDPRQPAAVPPFNRIIAIQKAPLFAAAPSLGTVTAFDNQPEMWTAQPAVSFDATAANAPAWVVATDFDLVEDVNARKITWNGATPTISGPLRLQTEPYAIPADAPALGSTTLVDTVGDRLMMAVKRNDRLWTARAVGVNAAGTATAADRVAVEWFELNVASGTPTVAQTGRIFDPAASTPRFYYMPSIMVNGPGHVALGFSGSAADEHIGAYTCGRLPTDSPGTMGSVLQIKAGEAPYTRVSSADTRNRWGDYSYTSLDPRDDMTLWTTQEYAESPGTEIIGSTSRYGTWVAELKAPAPQIKHAGGKVFTKAIGAQLMVNGVGFFDPGPGHVGRFQVELTGGTVNGISNLVVTIADPTLLSLTFDVSKDATPGFRNLRITNPDGQSATFNNALEIVKRISKSKGKLKVTPAGTIDFGDTVVGGTSTSEIRLENTGRQPLAITLGTVAPPFFALGPKGEFPLVPGAENGVTVLLDFSPTQAGPKSTSLKIKTNGKVKTVRVKLNGTGITR